MQEPSAELARYQIVAGPGKVATVTVAGELDMSNAAAVEGWVAAAAAAHPGAAIELDLAGVNFIDSTAVRALVMVRARLHGQGRTFRVRGADGIVARVLRTIGVLDALTGEQPAQTATASDGP